MKHLEVIIPVSSTMDAARRRNLAHILRTIGALKADRILLAEMSPAGQQLELPETEGLTRVRLDGDWNKSAIVNKAVLHSMEQAGFSHSCADADDAWLLILDADILLEWEKVRGKLEDLGKTHPTCLAAMPCGGFAKLSEAETLKVLAGTKIVPAASAPHVKVLCGGAFLISRRLFACLRGFDERLHYMEDADLRQRVQQTARPKMFEDLAGQHLHHPEAVYEKTASRRLYNLRKRMSAVDAIDDTDSPFGQTSASCLSSILHPDVPVRNVAPKGADTLRRVEGRAGSAATFQDSDLAVLTCAWGSSDAVVSARRIALASWAQQSRRPGVVMVELLEPGAKSRYADVLPPGSLHIVRPFDARGQRGLMHKEALLNIAAEATDARLLAFIDADVHSPDPEWFDCIGREVSAPDEPLVQVYRHFDDTKDSSRSAFSVGTLNSIRLPPGTYRQPGLGFAMTRSLWKRIGGLNPYCISGSGDVLLLDELCPGAYVYGKEHGTGWWLGVRRNLDVRPRLTFANVDVLHQHHGAFKERAYWESRLVLDWAETPIRELVEPIPSGLRWRNPDNRLADLLADKAYIGNNGLKAAARKHRLLQHTYHSIFGWFDFADCYRQIVSEAPRGATIVEIGCYLGRSTVHLGVEAHNSGKGLRIHAFDPCPDLNPKDPQWTTSGGKHPFPYGGNAYADLLTNIGRSGADVWFRRGDANAFVHEFSDESLHAVWLDADHLYESTLNFLDLWWPKIAPGGWFGGHDYLNRTWPGVGRAVDEWTKARGLQVEVRGGLPCASFMLRKAV